MKMMTATASTLFALSSFAQPQLPPATNNCLPVPTIANSGCAGLDATIVYAYAGDERTISWLPDPDDVGFRQDIRYNVEIAVWPLLVRIVNTTTAPGVEQIKWRPPRVGLYYVRIRGCTVQCSEWADSRDPASVDNGNAFMFVIAVKPPTGGGIEQ
jgi:hypothetical protein